MTTLSDAERERLYVLIEEMGEALQAAGKTLRHGYLSTHADYNNVVNRELLTKEIGDVLAAVDLMCAAHDIAWDEVLSAKRGKLIRVRRFLHHQQPEVVSQLRPGAIVSDRDEFLYMDRYERVWRLRPTHEHDIPIVISLERQP